MEWPNSYIINYYTVPYDITYITYLTHDMYMYGIIHTVRTNTV